MIKHILRDGTVLNDITGHVVKVEDAETVYTLIDKINERGNLERRTQKKEE